jgi:hypothetical protein
MSRPLVIDTRCQAKRSLSLSAKAFHILGMPETVLTIAGCDHRSSKRNGRFDDRLSAAVAHGCLPFVRLLQTRGDVSVGM